MPCHASYSPPRTGGTILSTKPPVYVLSTKNLEHFCSSCVSPAPATGLKRCTQCKNVWYCNAVRPSPLPRTRVTAVRIAESRRRLVKATIGRCTRKSVRRCSDGRQELHRRTLLSLQSRYDVWVACCGGGKSGDWIASGCVSTVFAYRRGRRSPAY